MYLSLMLAMTPETYVQREKDWRCGPVVYQVFVDRFAPSADLERKKTLYSDPRVIVKWSELPKPGRANPELGSWTHELEFWGGDLPSLQTKLGYIDDLGADVLYLNPIFEAFTNHKYDATDYMKVDPQYGSEKDLQSLTKDLHTRKMKLVLDGVFNHLGRRNTLFLQAQKDPKSPYRSWFTFDQSFPWGYKAWAGVANLPEIKLETAAAREYLWEGKDSVVQHYLRQGVDGWRLDVAFELGPNYLSDLNKAAKKAKKDAWVVGEISGYPADWFPAVDGVFNFTPSAILQNCLSGELSGGRATQQLADMVTDAGIENLLRSWTLVDNHDTPRLADVLSDWKKRRLAFAIQFLTPGSPVIYYGSELGMTGPGDPANRAPMRWDLVKNENENLAWMKQLVDLRKKHRSLRIGDFKAMNTEKLIGFLRHTDKLKDSVIVLINPTKDKVVETMSIRIGKLLSWGRMQDALSKREYRCINGMMRAELEPYSVQILAPNLEAEGGFDPYKRVE